MPDDVADRFPTYCLAEIDSLIPYERNSRTHSPAQIELLARSIKEYGWTNPVLIDGKKGIIAGHARVLAAKQLGMGVVPTVELSHLSEDQRRAYVIADNQSAINGAGWDNDLLSLELGELKDAGFDLSLTGFDGADLDKLLGDDEPPLAAGQSGAGSLAAQFGIPPFSVLNAREGWWQDRKASWIALGIRSEIGRGAAPDSGAVMPVGGGDVKAQLLERRGYTKPGKPNATPGGSMMPAADYSKRQRGDGRGRAAG